jgi:hypothetical protein
MAVAAAALLVGLIVMALSPSTPQPAPEALKSIAAEATPEPTPGPTPEPPPADHYAWSPPGENPVLSLPEGTRFWAIEGTPPTYGLSTLLDRDAYPSQQVCFRVLAWHRANPTKGLDFVKRNDVRSTYGLAAFGLKEEGSFLEDDADRAKARRFFAPVWAKGRCFGEVIRMGTDDRLHRQLLDYGFDPPPPPPVVASGQVLELPQVYKAPRGA